MERNLSVTKKFEEKITLMEDDQKIDESIYKHLDKCYNDCYNLYEYDQDFSREDYDPNYDRDLQDLILEQQGYC